MYTEAYRGFMSARIRNLVFLSVALTPAVARAQAPVGELFSTTAQVRGSVTLASSGTTVMSGSSITSGNSLPACN